MGQVSLLFVAEGFSVRDEKLKVARVRLINVRVVDLVHDAVAEREPEPATGVIRSADTFLRARSPTRLNPRSAEGNAEIAVRHLNSCYVPGLCQPPAGDTFWSTSRGPQLPGSYS